MLNAIRLTKSFKNKKVIEGVNFSISKGEIVGLVGPNGSGKTTLLNILMGMIKPTSGSFNIAKGAKVGMAVSRKGFFSDMTVKKNLMLYSKLLNVEEDKVWQMMSDFSIDFGEIRFDKLSAGMKQRVSLVLAFSCDNNLILLDEPTNHLDIDSIIKLRSIVLKLKELGVSLLITSHIFSDLEKTCDRILFLKNGRLVRDTTTIELIHKFGDLERAYLSIL